MTEVNNKQKVVEDLFGLKIEVGREEVLNPSC